MKKSLLSLIILLSISFTAFAVKMSSLYHVELLVASQTNDLREQAVREGLLQVLIKISGNQEIEKNPVIRTGLKRAEYYVQEYSYLSASKDASQYQLKISYEPSDVNRLLQKAKVAYWGENRPLTLVLLVVMDKQHDKEIISHETQNVIFDKITQEGKKYGLPLIFPVMDVDDLSHFSSDDIITMNIPVLKEAAKRYSPDVILIGEIDENNNNSQGRFQLLAKDNERDFQIENNTTDNVVTLVMTEVNQLLSGKNRVKQQDNN